MAVKDPIAAKSIRALAPLVDRGVSTVRKWTRDRRWPFSRYGPWTAREVRQMKVWAEMYLSHDPAAENHKRLMEQAGGVERPMTVKELTDIGYKNERRLWVKQQRLVAEGKVHDVAECRELIAGLVVEARGRILGLPRSISNSLAMQPAEEIERLLTAQCGSIVDLLAGDPAGSGSASSPPEGEHGTQV